MVPASRANDLGRARVRRTLPLWAGVLAVVHVALPLPQLLLLLAVREEALRGGGVRGGEGEKFMRDYPPFPEMEKGASSMAMLKQRPDSGGAGPGVLRRHSLRLHRSSLPSPLGVHINELICPPSYKRSDTGGQG